MKVVKKGKTIYHGVKIFKTGSEIPKNLHDIYAKSLEDKKEEKKKPSTPPLNPNENSEVPKK